jgi:hypothetical protein
MIEVFVCSHSMDVDVDTLREMSSHSYCYPGLGSALLKGLESKFKGRILSSEDNEVLERFKTLGEKCDDEVKVYDVSRATDRIKALSRGIRKTPTIINQGKKYEGIKEIQQWLSSKNP